MTLVVKDRVKETTSTTGTGALSLSGAADGFQSFAVIGNGNTTYYAITEPSTSTWEVGLGTYTLSGTTLARTIVLSSSNGGSAVNFGAGVKDVFVTYPAVAALSTLSDRGTGVTSTYVSTVAVGGTTFAQPAVDGEIQSDQGYFSINYAGATGITVATLTSPSTYVYIDNTGALQQQVTEPTREDWSRKIFTMRIAVNVSTNLILGFEYLNNPIGRYANSIRDLYTFLLANGVPFKQNQTVTGRGDLGFDVGAGTLMEFGGTGDINNANILSFDAVSNAEFFLVTRTGFDAGGNTDLPKVWDNAGTLTALGSTTVVGHRLYRFSNGNFLLQYGQGNYANLSLAKTGAVLEDYVLNPVLENATFFGWWFIESTATTTNGSLTSFSEYTIGIQGGSSGSLAGCLLKGNNLSDLLDAAAARTNLGLGTAATTAATAYATSAQGALAASATQPADLATIATTGNYANLVGTVPTWNQNTTGSSGSTSGNAATATTLQTARTISLTGDVTGSVSFNGSGNAAINAVVVDDSHNHVYGNIDGMSVGTLAGPRFTTPSGYIEFGPSNATWAHIYTDRPGFYLNKDMYVVGNKMFNDGYHPNADTLTTARTIGGVSFNGSANINLPGVNTTGNQNTSGSSASTTGNAATATTLQTARTINGVSFNGSANVTVVDATKLPLAGGTTTGTINAPTFNATSTTNGGFQGIDADSATTPSFTWTADLNTGMYRPTTDTIGFTTGGVLRLTVNSTGITSSGNVTASSDERLKKDWKEVKPNFVDQLANVKSGTYTRTDSDERQAGVSAQSLQELLPETVIAGGDGLLSVAYGNAAMVAVVELAKEIRKLKEELKALKGQ